MPESNIPTNNPPDPEDGPAPSVLIQNLHGLTIDPARWRQVVRAIALDHGFPAAEISLVIVDDETIHELNRRYLDHDYPTDVLSFALERDGKSGQLQGEVIVSADTAAQVADEWSVPVADELLLYAVHGMLHLVGYDDQAPADQQRMRSAEQRYLAQIGLADHPGVEATRRGAP